VRLVLGHQPQVGAGLQLDRRRAGRRCGCAAPGGRRGWRRGCPAPPRPRAPGARARRAARGCRGRS
jgi:hypothetical protein